MEGLRYFLIKIIIIIQCKFVLSQNDTNYIFLISNSTATVEVQDYIIDSLNINPFKFLDSTKWLSNLFIADDSFLKIDSTKDLLHQFIRIYDRLVNLYNSKINVYFKEIDSLMLIANAHYSNFNEIPIGIISLRYTTFSEKALDSGYILYDGYYYYENVINANQIYRNKEFFIAIPLLNIISNENYSLTALPFFILSHDFNTNNIIDSLFIIKDSLNSKTSIRQMMLTVNQEYKVTYRNYNNSFIIRKDFNMSNQSNILTTEIVSNEKCIYSVCGYKRCKICPTAKVTIYFSCGNSSNNIQKPFVFVEGFDPGTSEKRYNYGCLNWNVFKSGTGKSACNCIDLDNSPCMDCSNFSSTDTDKDGFEDYMNLQKVPSLINKLNSDGFDIVYVEFKYSTFPLSFNASALKEVIKWINQNKITNHKIILAGGSMGGLISRKALEELEQSLIQHNVRIWTTFDSPHYGANIPISTQFAVDFFATDHPIFGHSTSSQTSIEARNILLSPAAQEMLFYRFNKVNSALHTITPNFVSPINFIGPQKVRKKIAIANGNNNSIGQGLGNNAKILEINTCCTGKIIKGKGYADIFSLGSGGLVGYYKKEICPSSPFAEKYVYLYRTLPIDNAPGSYRKTIRSLSSQGGIIFNSDNHCFVPTISALAINPYFITQPVNNVHLPYDFFYNIKNVFLNPSYNYVPHPNIAYIKDHNITPFDVIYAPNTNQQHVEITDDNINFIMNEVSPFDLYLQNEYYPMAGLTNEEDVFEARNNITAGKNVTNKTAQGDFVIDAGADITFRAGDKIILKDGFKAKNGCKFRAYIDPFDCPPANRLSNSTNYNNRNTDYDQILANQNPKNTSNFKNDILLRNAHFLIIPNPANTSIFIQSPYNIQSVLIKDISGKNIMQQNISNTNSATLDISALANGLYFVQIQTEQGIFTEKLVVRH